MSKRGQSAANWAMLTVTVIAATASAIAVAQFRQRADQYRQTQILLTRAEGQVYRLETLSEHGIAAGRRPEVLQEREAAVSNLAASLRTLRENSTGILELSALSRAGADYLRAYEQNSRALVSDPQERIVYANLLQQLREAIQAHDEAAQLAIWRADLEGALGLLAFVVAIASILWRFGAARRQAEVASAEQCALERSEERFRTLTERSSDVIAILNADATIQYLSSSVQHVLGDTKEKLLGSNFLARVHPDDTAVARGVLRASTSEEDDRAALELRYLHSDGRWLDLEVFARNEALSESVGGIVINLRDVTDRKKAEAQLLHDATHDALTELPNRTLFLDRVQRAVNRARRDARFRFAVLFIDLDRFKVVNDTLGHSAGDRILKEVASAFSSCLRQGTPACVDGAGRWGGGDDTLARLGGDEFAVLLEELREPGDAVRVAQRILQRLESPAIVDGVPVYVNASIGVATNSEPYRSADEVVRNADIAMYRAKSSGGARLELVDAALHASALRRLSLESELRRALERNEFEVFYQPIVLLESSRVESLEALVRWRHRQHGLLNPSEFISIAEDTGLIVPLGRWVLRESCLQLRSLQQANPETAPSSVSVNLSAKEFAQPDLVDYVARAVEETGIDPECLRLEITESVAMADLERVVSVLKRMKSIGVRISIDDFGTGYSSLSYLRRFPVDTLKIDRSFISAMDEDDDSREIVRTIMTLARNLRMEVVAEGTETADQVQHLKVMRCKYAQGYFFSRPLDAAALAMMLSNRSAAGTAAGISTGLASISREEHSEVTLSSSAKRIHAGRSNSVPVHAVAPPKSESTSQPALLANPCD